MWASGLELDEEAREKAKEQAEGKRRIGLSPEAMKRHLKAKKERERALKKAARE